jgi:hypothetical protein
MAIFTLHFGAGVKSGLKGNPVKNRNYPRSCKF